MLHELRNPIAAITTHIEVLLEENSGPLEADLRALLAEVHRISLGLDGVSGFVRSIRSRGTVSAGDTVEGACRVLAPLAKRLGVELEVEVAPLPLLPFDRGVLSGLVFNLVKNAFDASKRGGRVRVVLSGEPTNRMVSLAVSDDGTGMSPEVLARCTDLFFTSKAKGSGIGLALCKRVAESSNGRLEIKSELNRGTTVTVWLPMDAEG
ncbi:MAG: HAMP domain-containing sensor histidine kinase [Polyangiaceae bacterium]